MATKYQVIVEAVVEEAQLQQQFNKITASKPIKIKAQLDQNDIPAQIDKWKNALTRMQIGKTGIFNSPEVRADLQELSNLIVKFGADGGSSAAQVNAGFDKLKTTVSVVAQNMKMMQQTNADVSKNQKVIASLQEQANKENALFDQRKRQIDEYVAKWNNALAKMQARAPKAFLSENVQKEVTGLNQLIAGFKTGVVPIEQVRMQLDKVNTAMVQTSSTMRNTNKDGMALGEMFSLAAKKVAIWLGATTAIYGSLRQIGDGIQYIKDLNKELTNIQLVSGASKEQVAGLAQEYNNLARELGATTLQIAQSSLTFIRQGKSIEETNVLVRNSTMLSKLAAIESAQSSEYLTSIMLGFKMSAEETSSALDKLISVDNASATSAGELAEALSRTSSVAQEAGVSFEELVALLGTASSVTRRSAESIGEAFKTIFTRMQNIKLGKLFEDETTTINDVEKSLSRVGIALRLNETTFRDMSDVLTDVAMKWSTFDDVTKASITQSLAGTRQANILVSVLNNWSMAQGLLTEEMNSTGLAAERFDTYLTGIEAHANQFTTAWEAMWQSTINSDAILFFIDFGTAALDAITKGGGLIPLLEKIIALVTILNAKLILNSFITFGKGIQSSYVALTAFAVTLQKAIASINAYNTLTTTLVASFGAISVVAYSLVAIIGSLVAVWITWNQQITKTQQAGLAGTTNAWADMFNKIGEEAKSTTEVLYAYENALERVNEAHRNAGIIAELFVDKEKIIRQGLQETIDELKDTTGNWQEYKDAVEEAARIAGYQVDEQGRIYESIKEGHKVVRQYVDDINALVAAEYDLYRASKLELIPEDLADFLSTGGELPSGEGPDFLEKLRLDKIKAAFEDLSTYMEDSLGRAFEQYNEQQTQAGIKAMELREKIALLSSQNTLSPEQKDQLIDLQAELYNVEQGIMRTGEAYIEATRISIINMAIQRINLSGLSEEAKNTALQIIYNLAATWGVMGNATAQVLTSVNQAVSLFAQNTSESAEMARAILENLGNQAAAISGDYYINMHVVTTYTDVRLPQGGDPKTGYPTTGTNTGHPLPNYRPPNMSDLGGGGGGGAQKQEKTYSAASLYQMIINLIREEKQAEIELLRVKQESVRLEQDALENQQDALDDQLDKYGEIIDARKDILRTEQEELDYQEEIADRNKSIAKLQNELAILSLDTSAESKARQLELQDELNGELEDLKKTQRDHSYDEQEKALDEEYKLYEESINKQKAILQEQYDLLEKQYDLVETQIAAIEEFLSKSGLVGQEAIQRLADLTPELYADLIAWNKEYGTGIEEDVVRAWEEAEKAIKKYKDVVDAIRGESEFGGDSGIGGGGGGGGDGSNLNWKRQYGLVPGTALWDEAVKLGKKKFLDKHPEIHKVPQHHMGLGSGPVGELKTPTNEVFTKLMAGEVVLKDSDMQGILARIPLMAKNFAAQNMGGMGGGLTIGNLINIEGSVSKDAVPDIERISKQVVREINKVLVQRGYNRGTQLFST